ncbi:hypothetical protein L1987_83331 [Smallanthus sonchifolius]|uniref:Uncharacterized protein n=1 Tax=Smallanthus sonchifolius TaxID=185202 RepID=A0ACB8YCK4_9ASTR|nr:hypothetical protein L1987_83331 [Smallanthus sonchifolius]
MVVFSFSLKTLPLKQPWPEFASSTTSLSICLYFFIHIFDLIHSFYIHQLSLDLRVLLSRFSPNCKGLLPCSRICDDWVLYHGILSIAFIYT